MPETESFHLVKDINVVDLASLVVTIGLAIYIGLYIEKRKANRRREKDIVIDYLDKVGEDLRDLHLLAYAGSFELRQAVRAIKELRMSTSRLGEMILYCKFQIKRNSLVEFSDLLRLIHQILTDTPVVATVAGNANSVSRGVVTLSDINLNALHREYNKALTRLRFLQLEINAL